MWSLFRQFKGKVRLVKTLKIIGNKNLLVTETVKQFLIVYSILRKISLRSNLVVLKDTSFTPQKLLRLCIPAIDDVTYVQTALS